MVFIYRAIFRPLQMLIQGSRRVAVERDFNYRIHLDTKDEVAELADAMNDMTDRFQRIRDDLDTDSPADVQVRQRTKEVVRSEKLASVGFLAAGVAHEINNPLASIAWCAESLEMRLPTCIQQDDGCQTMSTIRRFSCCGSICAAFKTRPFAARKSPKSCSTFPAWAIRQTADDRSGRTGRGVIEMVGHLGRYRGRTSSSTCGQAVVAPVNAQEIKQVVLEPAHQRPGQPGRGRHRARRACTRAAADCRVGRPRRRLRHEPRSARTSLRAVLHPPPRRAGHRPGLSITYRIVADHGGEIEADSDGPGQGSQFRVTLPLVDADRKNS